MTKKAGPRTAGPTAAACVALLCAFGPTEPGHAQTAGASSPAVAPGTQVDGAPIERVDVVLRRGSGNEARDRATLARLRALFEPLEGTSLSQALVQSLLVGPRSRIGAGSIDYRLLDASRIGRVVLLIELDTASADPGQPPVGVQGALAGEGASALPTLYRDDRSYLGVILSVGVGAYLDTNAWFGRPDLFTQGSLIAGNPPGHRTGWNEGFFEAGVHGATQIGASPFFAYGALSALSSASLGQDIYRDDTRSFTGIEKAYAGVLHVDPDSGASFNISAGRQSVTLNDGFLIHFVRGSANIGERGGTYIGPRNANDFSVVADVRQGAWSLKAFYIDPDELPLVDSHSTFAGLNLRRTLTPYLSLDATVITIPKSNSTFVLPTGDRLRREGLMTSAVHAHWRRAFGVEGLWTEGELAHQSHRDYAVSAWAGYGLFGYHFDKLLWKPSLSYRYAHASGDKPDTDRYERFDPLLSTGLGNWLQGISFGKITSNSNLAVHRLQLNVTPSPELNVTFDWHSLSAPQLNNLGSSATLSELSSHRIGQEFSLSARWAISRHFYFQGVASVARPGQALRDVGATKNWNTFQASLYWNY